MTFEPQFDPDTGAPRRTRQARGSKAEVRTAINIAARSKVRDTIAALRRAINKKSMGSARAAYRELERWTKKLDPDEDALMIKNAERLLKVARSRGIR